MVSVANSALHRLQKQSKFSSLIVIGRHNITSKEKSLSHEKKFVHPVTRKYDGAHFYGENGRSVYTQSVENIFQKADLKKPLNTEKRTEKLVQ